MDKKVSQLEQVTSPDKDDLLLSIVNTANTPMSKALSLEVLFDNVSWPVSVTGDVTFNSDFEATGNSSIDNVVSEHVAANNVIVNNLYVTKYTPSSSTGNVIGNRVFFDNNYLYISVANNVIKSVSLQNF